MRKINYKEKGITLVALVITIIILLILAGVTISTALGQNGLFQRARYAGEKYKESEIEEDKNLEDIEKEIDAVNPEKEKVTITFNSNGGTGEMEKITVDQGQTITLPKNNFTWKYHGFGKWNTDKDGNGKEYLNGANITVDKNIELYAMWADYGDSVEDRYEEVYTSFDSKNILKEKYSTGSLMGKLSAIYLTMNPPSEAYINEKQRGTSEHHTIIEEGDNRNNLLKNIKNKWTLVRFFGSYSSGLNIQISEFKLIFEDSKELTLKEAFENDYIEPLVLLQSKWEILNQDQEIDKYGWENFNEIINGDSGLGNYPMGWIYFKVKDKSSLTGIKFNSNKNWDKNVDGFFVVDCGDLELSITPF